MPKSFLYAIRDYKNGEYWGDPADCVNVRRTRSGRVVHTPTRLVFKSTERPQLRKAQCPITRPDLDLNTVPVVARYMIAQNAERIIKRWNDRAGIIKFDGHSTQDHLTGLNFATELQSYESWCTQPSGSNYGRQDTTKNNSDKLDIDEAQTCRRCFPVGRTPANSQQSGDDTTPNYGNYVTYKPKYLTTAEVPEALRAAEALLALATVPLRNPTRSRPISATDVTTSKQSDSQTQLRSTVTMSNSISCSTWENDDILSKKSVSNDQSKQMFIQKLHMGNSTVKALCSLKSNSGNVLQNPCSTQQTDRETASTSNPDSSFRAICQLANPSTSSTTLFGSARMPAIQDRATYVGKLRPLSIEQVVGIFQKEVKDNRKNTPIQILQFDKGMQDVIISVKGNQILTPKHDNHPLSGASSKKVQEIAKLGKCIKKPVLKCRLWPKVYSDDTLFRLQHSTHGGARNQCGVCGKQFGRAWLLKSHTRVHTGERPFHCKFPGCQKSFADKSNLRSHSKIHTVKTKTHVCEKCGRAFAQKRYLNKHRMEVCRHKLKNTK